MRSVAPPEVTIYDLYKGAIPFILLQMLGLGLLIAFPQIALWLPGVLYG
jgi:TRAP-type mannitol/chloroaromatic compound transport system permease large subunit